jgi:hypothetical protein
MIIINLQYTVIYTYLYILYVVYSTLTDRHTYRQAGRQTETHTHITRTPPRTR